LSFDNAAQRIRRVGGTLRDLGVPTGRRAARLATRDRFILRTVDRFIALAAATGLGAQPKLVHALSRKIEAFELEVAQHRPIDTDPSLHQKRRVEHKVWERTEFTKRFREDIRNLYPRMFTLTHPDSSLKTEIKADDWIRKLAGDPSLRTSFNVNLRVDAHHLSFSFRRWLKHPFRK
jgi:hypothetical protein